MYYNPKFCTKLKFDSRTQSIDTKQRFFFHFRTQQKLNSLAMQCRKVNSTLAICIPSSPTFGFIDIRSLDWWHSRVMCSGKVRRDCVRFLDIIRKIFGFIVITDLYQRTARSSGGENVVWVPNPRLIMEHKNWEKSSLTCKQKIWNGNHWEKTNIDSV